MSDKTESGLDLEEVAQSAYRTHSLVSGKAPMWEGLSFEDMSRWVRLAREGETLLDNLQETPFRVVGKVLAEAWNGMTHRPAGWKEMLAWEAVARHLATLYDAETPPQLPELEAAWPPWAQAREELYLNTGDAHGEGPR